MPWFRWDAPPSDLGTRLCGVLVAVADLVAALAGGAIGAVLAGLAWIGLRVAAIPDDLDRHDFEARVLNEDLELWANDTYRALKQELTRITNEMAAKGQLYSGAHGLARAEAKTQALHRWRDRRHEAERDVATLQSRETWLHGLWRKWSGHKPLELTAVHRVEPVIEELRRPVTAHGGKPSVKVHDPTRFKLEDLLDAIERSPLEPVEPPQPPSGEQVEEPPPLGHAPEPGSDKTET